MRRRLTSLFRPRSNGVRVTRTVLRDIRRGDAARGRGDWGTAAGAYRAALAAMPGLGHIWIQYGHAAKEAGDRTAAAEAYARAAALRPADAEPHIHLGHLAKRAGTDAAARHFLEALRRSPDELTAASELTRQLLGRRVSDTAMLDEMLALLRLDRAEVMRAVPVDAPEAGTVFLDATDLMNFFSASRIPTGVQRVQMEIILALGRSDAGRGVAICHHSRVRRGWSIIPHARFDRLCAASRSASDDAADVWRSELGTALMASALADDIAFPAGSVLVSLGANSPDPNYLLDARTAHERQGLAYLPMVHDLIPELFPDWFTPNHAADYRIWLASVVGSASGFLANSAATRADLLRHAERIGAPIRPDRARIVRLDGETPALRRETMPPRHLARWGLSPGGYVLFVATIEPRKNHLGALRAWLALARSVGEQPLPHLVCVGGRGWLNDAVHTMIAEHAVLRRRVVMLHGIDDAELALLYAHCAFTFYPSFYEGWGLPITESLCHGKLPVVSNTSSMPEAGGELAVYFDPHDPAGIAATLRPLVTDPAIVRRWEARIAAEFEPRSWLRIATELVNEARTIAGLAAPDAPPEPPASGERYSLTLGGGGGRDGELFRHGTGWATPGDDGCRVEEHDALLRFAAPDVAALLDLELAAGDEGAAYRIRGAGVDVGGDLAPHEARTVSLPLAPARAVAIEIAAVPARAVTVRGFTLRRA